MLVRHAKRHGQNNSGELADALAGWISKARSGQIGCCLAPSARSAPDFTLQNAFFWTDLKEAGIRAPLKRKRRAACGATLLSFLRRLACWRAPLLSWALRLRQLEERLCNARYCPCEDRAQWFSVVQQIVERAGIGGLEPHLGGAAETAQQQSAHGRGAGCRQVCSWAYRDCLRGEDSCFGRF